MTSAFFVILWLAFNFSISTYSTYKIDTQESVSGLLVGAPVEYKGVDIGKVKDINLKNAHWVEILLSIRKDAPITKGTEASLTTRGLTTRGFTGFVYISLKDKGTDLRSLEIQSGQVYPVIPTTSSTTLSLDTTLVEMNQNLKEITALFQSILDKETIGSLKDLLHNMKEVSATLVANNQKLHSLLVNTEKASHQFEPFLKTGQNTMKRLESELKPFLKTTEDTMSTLEKQTLPALYHTLKKLDDLSRSLLNVANEIKQNPSILIRGTTPPIPGPGEEDENK
jgi:phospholipid/cholesterol/gamma-HCH transport system substrate-binding protein